MLISYHTKFLLKCKVFSEFYSTAPMMHHYEIDYIPTNPPAIPKAVTYSP